jgi:hypothetical protein
MMRMKTLFRPLLDHHDRGLAASMSVRYHRLTSSSWSSKHSVRDTSSGRFELNPSSSHPTFLEFSVCWSWREDGGIGV